MPERRRVEQYPLQLIARKIGVESAVLSAAESLKRKWLGGLSFSKQSQEKPQTEEVNITVIEAQAQTIEVGPTIQQTTTEQIDSTDSVTVGPQGITITRRKRRSRNKVTSVTGDPTKDQEIFKLLGLPTPPDPNESTPTDPAISEQ